MFYVNVFTDDNQLFYLADSNEYDGEETYYFAKSTLTLFASELAARKAMQDVVEFYTVKKYEIVDFATHRIYETVEFQEEEETNA